MKQISTSQPFKILVAHPSFSSDPSKGEAGNPPPLRQAFQGQVIQTTAGTGVLGNVTTNRTTLIIEIASTEYGNPNVVQAPPFYDQDLIQVYSHGYTDNPSNRPFIAGYDFGSTAGNGQGLTTDVASSLVTLLNNHGLGVTAELDPNNASRVRVSSTSITDPLVINISSIAFNLFNGNPPFKVYALDGSALYDPAVDGKGTARIIYEPNSVTPLVELS